MKKKKTKMSTRDLSAGEVETGESLELPGKPASPNGSSSGQKREAPS